MVFNLLIHSTIWANPRRTYPWLPLIPSGTCTSSQVSWGFLGESWRFCLYLQMLWYCEWSCLFSNWFNKLIQVRLGISLATPCLGLYVSFCGPDYKDAYVEGKMKAFLNDLYSGKLHREFHYGPDPETTPEAAQVGLSIHPWIKSCRIYWVPHSIRQGGVNLSEWGWEEIFGSSAWAGVTDKNPKVTVYNIQLHFLLYGAAFQDPLLPCIWNKFVNLDYELLWLSLGWLPLCGSISQALASDEMVTRLCHWAGGASWQVAKQCLPFSRVLRAGLQLIGWRTRC